jgi:hypothetical protein
MIPCSKVFGLDALSEMSQQELIQKCGSCLLSKTCDLGYATLNPQNIERVMKQDAQPSQPIETLEYIARTSMTFSEYLQKAEKVRNGENRHFTKNEEDSLENLARQSMSFGEFQQRIEQQRKQKHAPTTQHIEKGDLEGNIDLMKIATESANFSEYMQKVKKLREI